MRETGNYVRSLRQQYSQQVQGLQQIIQSQINRLAEKERQLGQVNQQLEESEQVNVQFQRQIAELEQLRPPMGASSSSKEQSPSIKLTWREGEKAPCEISESYRAAVDGSTLYVVQTGQVFCYIVSTSSWSGLPGSPTFSCASVIINNFLSLVGGYRWVPITLINHCSASLGRAVVGGGLRNSHTRKQSSVRQWYCALIQL